LNPDKSSFCLNSTVTHLEIPILVNQTEPIEMELVRIDVENNMNETITIKKSELKTMMKKARKSVKSSKTVDPAAPLTLRYTVKKKGVYLLSKVMDQSKLEVRPRASSAVVATCPQARVRPTGDHRCRNDLSNVAIEVEGVPPLSVKYRLVVDNKPRGGSEFQNLQSEDSISPLSRHSSQALVRSGREDVSWALSQTITVPLNETLVTGSRWEYAVEEVQDGLGNFVSFVNVDDEDRPKAKPTGIHQSFQVHERPKIFLDGCNPQNPLRVAKGNKKRLPVSYMSTGKHPVDGAHMIEYLFTPEVDVQPDGYHRSDAELKKRTMVSPREQPIISAAGLYTLNAVSTDFCEGEVLEPTSCLLQNPPEPELSLSSEDIVDKCAGNPIGLRVALDFIGTPPFYITYSEQEKGYKAVTKHEQVASLRGTIDLTPKRAGHYTYKFVTISDAVYRERQLPDLQLQQSVKPPASAHFNEGRAPKQACINDEVNFDVGLVGEGPFKLEYELVHNGKRTKYSVDVEEQHYTIHTPELKSGGEYTVALLSVTDKTECKIFLKDAEAKVHVRHERPKAYFGHIEGKQSVMALEGRKVDLPLRLTGAKPWRLEYKNLDTEQTHKVNVPDVNAVLGVVEDGTYELIGVHDSVCPGFIEKKASRFTVGWIARPKISIPESPSIRVEGNRYVKEEVCEGDEDSFEVSLTGELHPFTFRVSTDQIPGNAPFDASYRQEYKTKGKTAAVSDKELRAMGGSTTIRTDTSKSGVYEYTFLKLSDNRYDHSKKHFTPVTVQQTVNPRPSARFNNPGKTYSYCSREADGEEVIPVTLEGVPPFYLEVEIKHAGTPTPEVSTHRDIVSNKYDLKIEHRKLHLGHSAITIRKVRDARGCSFRPPPGGPRVSISVHDAPTATALEDRTDFCVGERLSYALGGQVPFTVYYDFNTSPRKASNAGTTFRRLAELPGNFTITGLRDSASECLASLSLTKYIHPIPSVRLSGGQVTEIDIHEGGGTDLDFSFTGTPPFEFTYTRSTNAGKGRKSKVLEIRTEISQDFSMKIPVQEEGTYEVVSIKDRWCGFAKQVEGVDTRGSGQKLLQY
jgi:nucleoporin POM152